MNGNEQLTGKEQLPSVWIEQKTKGEITFGVNVPSNTVGSALVDAKRVFEELREFVKKLQADKVNPT